MRYTKSSALPTGAYKVSVTTMVQTAYGPDRYSTTLPTVYASRKLAMAAAHVVMQSGDYMSAMPVQA
jgi:hypothetical protein